MVLWDKIVLRGDNTKLTLRDVKSKYFFFDDGNGLRLVPFSFIIYFFYFFYKLVYKKVVETFFDSHVHLLDRLILVFNAEQHSSLEGMD